MPPPRQQPARVLRAGGSLRSGSRFTVQAAQFRRLFVAPHHSARSTLAAALAGRLNKTCILSSQPAVCRRRCGVGSFAPLTPCRLRRHILAACGGVRNSRSGLRVAVQKARQQVHIIVSRTYHCDSKAAELGRYCKFCDTVSLRKFSSHYAALPARRAVF